MSKSTTNSNKSDYTKKVKVAPSTGLGENLKVKLTESKTDYVIIWIGSPGMIPSQVIIHRPIGKTLLGEDVWVASDSSDVALLLTRKENPREKEIREKRNAFLRKAAADEGLIKISSDGVVSYPDGKDRNTFLKTPRAEAEKLVKASKKDLAAWKEADKKTRPHQPPKKLVLNEEILKILKGSKDKSALEEIAYGEFISAKENKEKAENAFPDDFETMKGVYGDTHQESLEWDEGLTLSEVKDAATSWTAALTGRDLTGPVNDAILALTAGYPDSDSDDSNSPSKEGEKKKE
jgi:hypothetical protein